MSQLQEKAKAHLLGLFDGTASSLDAEARAAVAAWVAMATMTGEHLSHDPTKIAVPQSDRNWLMNIRTAPKDWRIWVGRYERRAFAGQWVHVTVPILSSENLPSAEASNDRLPKLQTTAFVVGRLFVFAMSSVFAEIPRLWDWRTAPRARTLLRQLWPHIGGTLVRPCAEMTDTQAEAFATAYQGYSDDLALRVGYR
jgi:hypothetical protein